jgi:hypothetical protein
MLPPYSELTNKPSKRSFCPVHAGLVVRLLLNPESGVHILLRSVAFNVVVSQKTEDTITIAVRNSFVVEVEIVLFLRAKKKITDCIKTQNLAPLISKRPSYRMSKHVVIRCAIGRR